MNPVDAIIEDAKRYAESMGWSMTRFCNEAGIAVSYAPKFSTPSWTPGGKTLRKIGDCIERGKSIIPTPPNCQHPDNCRAKGFNHCGTCGALVRWQSAGVEDSRAIKMVEIYREGRTLKQIGDEYGISRERVRQIISKTAGLTGADGGQAVKSRQQRARQKAKREADCLARHGCTVAQYKDLQRLAREHEASGGSRETSIIGAFCKQRSTAKARGISWDLTLWDWWTIWEDSGRWSERGKCHGQYAMCRYGDDGPYSIENVYIDLAARNVSDGNRRNDLDLPIGVYRVPSQRFVAHRYVGGKRKYLGTFDTPKDAHQAYLDAI